VAEIFSTVKLISAINDSWQDDLQPAYVESMFEDQRSVGNDAVQWRIVSAKLLQLLFLDSDDITEFRSFSLQFTRLIASHAHKQAVVIIIVYFQTQGP